MYIPMSGSTGFRPRPSSEPRPRMSFTSPARRRRVLVPGGIPVVDLREQPHHPDVHDYDNQQLDAEGDDSTWHDVSARRFALPAPLETGESVVGLLEHDGDARCSSHLSAASRERQDDRAFRVASNKHLHRLSAHSTPRFSCVPPRQSYRTGRIPEPFNRPRLSRHFLIMCSSKRARSRCTHNNHLIPHARVRGASAGPREKPEGTSRCKGGWNQIKSVARRGVLECTQLRLGTELDV